MHNLLSIGCRDIARKHQSAKLQNMTLYFVSNIKSQTYLLQAELSPSLSQDILPTGMSIDVGTDPPQPVGCGPAGTCPAIVCTACL